MSYQPLKPPQTDAEWARNTESRVNSLENSDTVRIGEWVISSKEDTLIATKPGDLIDLGAQGGDTTIISGSDRGYVDTKVKEVTDAITGGTGDDVNFYLSQKWNELIQAAQNATDAINDAAAALGYAQDVGDSQTQMGQVLDDVKYKINTTVYDIIDAFGIPDLINNTFDLANSKKALKAQADSTAQLFNEVAKMQAATAAQGNSGRGGVVDFSLRPDSVSLGYPPGGSQPDFTQGYSGSGTNYLGIVSGRAAMPKNNSDGPRTALALLNNDMTLGDYQMVGCAFAGAPETYVFNHSNDTRNLIVCRSNPYMSTYVYAELQANKLILGCFVNGVQTILQTKNDFKFAPNSSYWLMAGNQGSIRNYEVWCGSTPVLQYTDWAATTQYGIDNRFVGFGMFQYADGLWCVSPAKINAFAWSDNRPPAVVGSGFRAARTLTGTADVSQGTNVLPNGWYNVVDYQTPDYTWDANTANKLTVKYAGWYTVNFQIKTTNTKTGGLGVTVSPVLFINGVVKQSGTPIWCSTNNVFVNFGGTFVVYLNANDYIQPGYKSNQAVGILNNVLDGEGSGVEAYFEATLTNKSLS